MKLRFRGNSLRLRLNQREVAQLAAGSPLEERVFFPGDTCFCYILEPSRNYAPEASFHEGVIRVSAPAAWIEEWASTAKIGLYFALPANGAALQVAVEKDLECIDGPPEELDPDAFPRSGKSC
jgi:hypothetical protein